MGSLVVAGISFAISSGTIPMMATLGDDRAIGEGGRAGAVERVVRLTEMRSLNVGRDVRRAEHWDRTRLGSWRNLA